jgi:hypothetical protein
VQSNGEVGRKNGKLIQGVEEGDAVGRGSLRTKPLNTSRVSKFLSVSSWSHNGNHPSAKTT